MPTLYNAERSNSPWCHRCGEGRVLGGQPRHYIRTNASSGLVSDSRVSCSLYLGRESPAFGEIWCVDKPFNSRTLSYPRSG